MTHQPNIFSDTGTIEVNVPGFSPPGIDYTIDVERYDSTSGSFVPVTQITGVQRDQFSYTIGNLVDGVYAVRVDGQTPTGTRTFSISRTSIPEGKLGNGGLTMHTAKSYLFFL